MSNNDLKLASLIALTTLLSGCALDDVFSNDDDVVNVEDIKAISTSEHALVKSNAALTERVLKNGLVLNVNRHNCWDCRFETLEASTDAVASPASSSGDYSETTTQETGIDESDRVKYDGDRLYIASNHYYRYYASELGDVEDEDNSPHVRILLRNEDDSLSAGNKLVLGNNATNVNDLYVNDNKLLAIYQSYSEQNTTQNNSADLSFTSDIWFPYQQQFGLTFADVTDTNNVVTDTTYTIDGYPISSRRIDNKVYLLSSYSSDVAIEFDSNTQALSQQQYEELVESEDIQYLPQIHSGDTSRDLVSGDDCYLPENSQLSDGYGSVAILTTFDLANPENVNSICVITPINGVYASSDHLYLYQSGYQYDETNDAWTSSTNINQFSYTSETLVYNASKTIDGQLGWSNPHLRLSEHNGSLRVVTTDNQFQTGPQHKLHVLDADSENSTLEVQAVLPNAEHPEKIGKPGEDIYAVRYFGDKAYIVTFERRDPLYVVDLTDPVAPFIAGELDIPGYSAYIHPLNESFIVGIGMQVDPELNTPNADPDFVGGAKIELYDVSNPSAPAVVQTLVYENGNSVVEWDYHALSVLKISDEEYRFAFPVSSWQVTEQQNGDQSWNFNNSLQMVDVNLEQGGSLTQRGELNADVGYYGSWGDRAILHSDIVYYIRHNSVWQSYWSMPNVMNGPY